MEVGYKINMSLPTIFFISMKHFYYTSVHLNLTLVEHNLIKGDSICAHLCHISLKEFTSPTNLSMSRTLVGAPSLLMASIFDKRYQRTGKKMASSCASDSVPGSGKRLRLWGYNGIRILQGC